MFYGGSDLAYGEIEIIIIQRMDNVVIYHLFF